MRHLYEKKKRSALPKTIVLLKKCKKKILKKINLKKNTYKTVHFYRSNKQKMSIVRRAIPRLVKIIEKG